MKTKTSHYGCVIVDEICDNLVINKENMSKILKKIRKIEIEPETLAQSQNGVRICNRHEKLD